MNRQAFLAIAAVALAASAGVARADDADASQYVHQFQGSLTRAEVQADAVRAVANRSSEPAGSRVAAPVRSALQRDAVREQTADAVRRGETNYGEAGRG